MISNLTSATLLIALKVAAGIILALLTACGLQYCQNSRLSDKLVQSRVNEEKVVESNGTLVATMNELRVANSEWASKYEADTKKAEAAAKAARERAAELDRELSITQSELEVAYGTEDCESRTRTRVCSAVADRLFDGLRRNESGDPNGDSDGQSPDP